MKTLGVIVEYNPFHNGHLYHINMSKKITCSDKCIAVMSGNYVQRGTPAFCDKYLRTEMALRNGVDIVIELPVYYAASSAEYFASSAIRILNSIGIVSSICFGTELEKLDTLYEYADILVSEPSIYKATLKKLLNTGISYPKARHETLKYMIKKDVSFLNNPNNILALEYIKALIKTSSHIKPYSIQRYIAGYHSTELNKNISSATAIRKALLNNNYASVLQNMPRDSYQLLIDYINKKKAPVDIDAFSHIFHYIIKNSNPTDLKEIQGIDEGLENRVLLKSNDYFEISKIINSLKCKRYTYTKLQRSIMHIILNIKKQDFINFNLHGGPQYIRVLGFRKESSFLLKKIKDNSSIPLITNIKDSYKNLNPLAMSMLNKEIATTDIYYLGQEKYKESPLPKNIEYAKPLVII